jgi:mRNA interferase RelE/StbE
MKFKIVLTKTFEKSLKKLSPAEQKQVAIKLKILQTSPFHPSLRAKKIKGFSGLFECSVNMDIHNILISKNVDNDYSQKTLSIE